MMEADHQV